MDDIIIKLSSAMILWYHLWSESKDHIHQYWKSDVGAYLWLKLQSKNIVCNAPNICISSQSLFIQNQNQGKDHFLFIFTMPLKELSQEEKSHLFIQGRTVKQQSSKLTSKDLGKLWTSLQWNVNDLNKEAINKWRFYMLEQSST